MELNELPENIPMSSKDKDALSQYPLTDKYYFLTIFEQVEIAINSGLINEVLANHMFGFYAITCMNSSLFWQENMVGEKTDLYWNEFFNFVKRMERVYKSQSIERKIVKI